MTESNCRQCGTSVDAAKFPSGEFECPDCGWRELLTTSLGPRKRKQAGAGVATESATVSATAVADPESSPDGGVSPAELDAWVARPSAASAPPEVLDLQQLRSLDASEFTHWCTALLERFGFSTRVAPTAEADCSFEISRHGQTVFVDCVWRSEGELVDRATCQRLVGAMVGAGVNRGMLITAGLFGDRCREFADQLEGFNIDLIDGERLEETVMEMTTGPLSVWWR